MFKVLCLLIASAILIEGAPPFSSDLAEAVKSGNWDAFNSFLRQYTQNNWLPNLAANVENLKPDGNSHVFGHSVSAYKEWHNDNGKVTEDGKGIEIINKDGQVTKYEFKP